MTSKRLGKQSVRLENPPAIHSAASIVGVKEGEGPLGSKFDKVLDDDSWGEESFEKAESKILRETLLLAVGKGSLSVKDIDYVLAGDLLANSISASFAVREMEVPFFGVYGACSTMAESMSLGAMLVDGGFSDYLLCGTSSHFCSAERQFRMPLEYGGQRPPSAQWTVTGSGAVVLAKEGKGPFITSITTGKIVDLGVKDANNMGAAMAPAAVDTIVEHFHDTGRSPKDYDVIVTGDLGVLGHKIADELLKKEGYDLGERFQDSGMLIFDNEKQDTHMGGSGCGCAGSVFCAHFYPMLKQGKITRMLLVATGALLSTTSTMQKESIPSIAHAISIESEAN